MDAVTAPRSYSELLRRWMDADARTVDGWNRYVAELNVTGMRPTSEQETQFQSMRVAGLSTALATLLRMLADESDGK